ncbi:protein of unknown function [Flaviramulus basaltis]|uniref:Uncharacterized protein n=1 Tax=Flaviramulus basaltis TaxID=369401 RepID=A0A1K2IJZ4_9FLAO|nr:DUF4153 domain-containing protein [Flaviramulus basaltis]SFZ92711.1 protein of unknown function [Flaviramulus basaltis]
MKKIFLFIGAILFSILFHKQGVGLNLSIFSFITLILLVIFNKSAFKQKSTLAYSVLYLITAITVFIYNNSLSIIANFVAFFTLVGQVSEQNSSIYINWINGLYTIVAGYFHRNFNINETKQKVISNKDIDYLHLIKIIGIPLALIIVFICLYKNGNPMFNELVNKIDFSFINFQWLLVAICGYYLLNNICKPVIIEPTTTLDINTGNYLSKKGEINIGDLKKEHQFGFILISALNLLIILFLITDITYLLTSNDLRASTFSNQVHSSIYTLIASIVIAIIIILYFFRGNLNFYSKNRSLKTLAYLWITLNSILIVNILIKDFQYIYYFGFTYKRIGVLIYLLLTVIGLITTFIKVKNVMNFWYLFRINSLTTFTILVTCATVNWDGCITIYNLNYAKSMDFKYLIRLSNNNVFTLINYLDDHNLDNYKNSVIRRKYKRYLKELNAKSWQEIQFDNFKIK